MAIFHMTQVIHVVGTMLVSGLASVIGARWAAASMSLVGTAAIIALYVLVPRAPEIQ
jgi:hypothetical protein